MWQQAKEHQQYGAPRKGNTQAPFRALQQNMALQNCGNKLLQFIVHQVCANLLGYPYEILMIT